MPEHRVGVALAAKRGRVLKDATPSGFDTGHGGCHALRG